MIRLRRLGPGLYVATVVQLVAALALAAVWLRVGQPPPPDPEIAPAAALATALGALADRPEARQRVLQSYADHVRAQLLLADAAGRPVASAEPPPALGAVRGRTASLPVRGPDGAELGRLDVTPVLPPPPRRLVGSIVAALLLALAGTTALLARRVVRPLAALEEAARRFGEGELNRRSGIRRDDELGSLARSFDEMASRISSLIEQQSQFLGNVSHELRTPLARMRAALDLAAAGLALDPEIMGDLARDVGELERLVRELLELARWQVHGPERRFVAPAPDLEPVDLVSLARDAGQRFGLRHPGRGLRLELPPGLEVRASVVLLRRALDNLLDNAAAYADRAAPVVLAVRAERAGAVVEVRDRGPGMSPSDLERAFEPFFRAEPSRSRRTGGVGLGLSFARMAVQAQGGDLVLRSEPGVGMTATILLRRGPQTP
ncbi:MAG TPA: HAMP domain-containing sensor histidine kinase [Polyangiaceae bacterium]|nr:HAMP domain-containing sensor histidine kinase [Polyangiaceae bacterium]